MCCVHPPKNVKACYTKNTKSHHCGTSSVCALGALRCHFKTLQPRHRPRLSSRPPTSHLQIQRAARDQQRSVCVTLAEIPSPNGDAAASSWPMTWSAHQTCPWLAAWGQAPRESDLVALRALPSSQCTQTSTKNNTNQQTYAQIHSRETLKTQYYNWLRLNKNNHHIHIMVAI